MAEAKRVRRREKEAFLKTVSAANNDAAANRAALRKNAPDAAAGTADASKKRPPRVHRVDNEPGIDTDSAAAGVARREQPGRAWPYGPVCMAVPARGREPGSKRGSGESRGGSCAGEIEGSAADAGAAGAGAVGAAVRDAARAVSSTEGGIVAPGTDTADTADAGNSSTGNQTGNIAAEKQDTEHPTEGTAGKRGSGCTRKRSDHHADGSQQQLQPAILRQQENESEPRATDQERVPRVATPSAVVTSSVRVLDMGVVRPSE